MLRALGARLRCSLEGRYPWTGAYGLGRTLLALATATTLASNSPADLFVFQDDPQLATGVCRWPSSVGLFCLLHSHPLWARWIALGVLLVVATGWRPMITALPHWWVSFSYHTSAVAVDGGDHVVAALTLLFLPVALTDRRAWHWGCSPPIADSVSNGRLLIALSGYWAVRLQVSGIYLHSVVAKLRVEEWINGTAMYYWLSHPDFGLIGWLVPVLQPIVSQWTVAPLTWSVLLLEGLLALGLVLHRRWWAPLLWIGTIFHLAIATSIGLITFSVAMIAALQVYLRPWDVTRAVPRGAGARAGEGLRLAGRLV